MSPIKQSGMINRLDNLTVRSPATRRRDSTSNDWFSLSSSTTAAVIHTTAAFASGTSIDDISSKILSFITEDEER